MNERILLFGYVGRHDCSLCLLSSAVNLWGQNTDKVNEHHSLFVNQEGNDLEGENYTTRNQVNRTIIDTTETEKENEQALSILSRWTEVDAVITPEILFKWAKLYI